MNDLPNLNLERVEEQEEALNLDELAELKIEIMLSALSGSASSQTSEVALVARANKIADEVLKLMYSDADTPQN